MKLVHEQDRRVVQERPGDGQALLHAGGVVGEAPVRRLDHVHPLQQLANARLDAAPRDVVEAREEVEVLAPGQSPVERPLVGVDEADLRLDLPFVDHVLAADHRSAAIGQDQAREDLEERRLAGAVRPEESEDLPLLDVKIHSAQRLDALRPPERMLGKLADRALLDEGLLDLKGLDGEVHAVRTSGGRRL
jgi:hypothetical protein